jgi:hypothetical protein
MKKGIIVLLITVLVAGFAFADVTEFSGSAAVSYGVGLDENAEFGFKNSAKTTFKFNFEFATAEVDNAEHSTDFWAEIGASASAGYTDSKYALEAEITKANIHVKDLTINILGPKGPYNYAASWTKDADKKSIFDFANKLENKVGGVELLYGGYSLSIAQYKGNTKGSAATKAKLGDIKYVTPKAYDELDLADYIVLGGDAVHGYYVAEKIDAKASGADSSDNKMYVGLQTKSFELAEGMTFQAAANGFVTGTKSGDTTEYDTTVGAAAKFGYKNEEKKISANVAADVQYDDQQIYVDALVSGGYDFVTAKAYFGFKTVKDSDPKMALELNAKATYKVNDDVTVTAEAEADRMLNAKKQDGDVFGADYAGYTVKAGATVKQFGVNAYFNYNQAIDTLIDGKTSAYGMNAGADVTYTAEKFTAKAGASVNFCQVKTEMKPYGIKPSASISSTALVENCTLSLAWAGARFLTDKDFETIYKKTNGTITASAKIEF